MRHATVFALDAVHKWLNEYTVDMAGRSACTWEPMREEMFTLTDVSRLRAGVTVELPTCPDCAVLLDKALELRGNRWPYNRGQT